MSSNQLKNRNQYHGPTNFLLRPILLLMDNSRLQMDLESFVIKPAPRTDKEVLIKSAAVNKKNNDSYKNRK
jgi:hypothetical protein